ncbi:MAG: HEAT repeat domain-containing protein [Deltaproteobacteria bacterium]|nr:HEAT repeat domain-containing protein [Deltaproteobacteria bacterium]
MSAQTTGARARGPIHPAVNDFMLAFMRAVNTGRLYAQGHELFAKHLQQLNAKTQKAMTDRFSLFIGLARDSIFFEGSFHRIDEPNIRKFLAFFHFLGISYLLVGKRITEKELESFISILAGAKRGQGSDVVAALDRENVRNVRVGLLDYSIFASVQAIASRLTRDMEDEALWRQLILQPAGAGPFSLSEEQTQRLISVCEDKEGLKEMLLQLDKGLSGVSVDHRGILIGNFIHNVGNVLSRVGTEKRKSFTLRIAEALNALGLDRLSEDQLLGLLREAIRETGIRSTPFNNLFKSAISRYRDPSLLLDSVRKRIELAAQEKAVKELANWQDLEQLLVRHQEMAEFHARYREQIEGLAASISIQGFSVEGQETGRILGSISPESLRKSKAWLIVELIGQDKERQSEVLLRALLDRFGELLAQFVNAEGYGMAGDLIRGMHLALGDCFDRQVIRDRMRSLLKDEDVKSLFMGLLSQCKTYGSRETASLDVLCRMFPSRAVALLIDVFVGIEDGQDERIRWLKKSMASLGPYLGEPLARRFERADDHNEILRLLEIAPLCEALGIVPTIVKFLGHQRYDIRLKAIKAAGSLKAEGAVPVLSEIVSQRPWLRTKKKRALQAAAVKALAEIGSERSKEVLRRVIEEGPGDLRSLCEDLV